MICAVNSAQTRRRFAAALADPRAAGVACQLGASETVFGPLPGSGWQFYTSGEEEPPFALGIRGQTALLAGAADAEELAGFLGFLGVSRLRCAGTVPEGWQLRRRYSRMVLPAGEQLPRRELPAGFLLEKQPAVSRVTEFLCRGESLSGDQQTRDCFYSETCTLVNHGRALLWAVRDQAGELVATAGAYALWNKNAYLAGVETARDVRGNGLAGALVAGLANQLAEQGILAELLCLPELEEFYRQLGFIKQGEVSSYSSPSDSE